MVNFLLVWLGQFVSVIGSRLTGFALGVWTYQHTHSVTQFALIYLFTYLPGTLLSPIAGTLVDCYDRRKVMIASNCGSGLSSLVMAWLFFAGRLETWQIYLALAVVSTCNILLFSAYTAAITLLVPKQHFSRASGLVQLAQAASQILAPMLAGMLVITIQVQGVLLIDCMTFLFALATLLYVRFPKPEGSSKSSVRKESLFQDMAIGWKYIATRSGLLGLLLFFTIPYFTLGTLETLFTPMILSFASTAQLGLILSIGGVGWLSGSLCISFWGGPKRRIYGVFTFVILQGLLLFLGALKPSIPIAATGIFGYLFAYPILLSCSQAIWQSKVPPNFQGRVFGVRYLIEHLPPPIAYLTVGILADYIFEPLFASGGLLTSSVGQIIGVGPGRGIALMFILVGTINILATVAAYRYPRLRLVEDELPDMVGH
ncbi:MFS transporter [Microcoleus sp. B7-D4]|uniref:MFS transporter n=1 Tax=Microcoleus sp. B7-D4 TaxID=2818696 RepID=UPI002FD753B7